MLPADNGHREEQERDVTDESARMNEMVERVARAMFDKGEKWLTPCAQVWETAPPVQKLILLAQARAAIAAMREPTKAMLQAFYGDVPRERWLGDDWRDMIDEALR